MSQSEARPHFLTYFVREGDSFKKVGPILCDSRSQAIRMKREARALYGERFSTPTVEAQQLKLDFPQ
jgi:hypothetical protein